MSTTSSSGTVTSARMDYAGGCNVSYDLTGRDSEFLKSSQYVHYINGEQTIELPVPAFVLQPTSTYNTQERLGVRIYTITDTVDGLEVRADKEEIPYIATKPEEGTSDSYWTSVEDDQTAMGKAFLLWNDVKNTFDGKLCKKLLVHLEKTTNVRILVEYQAFWKDALDTAQFRGERGPQYTREFGQHIVDTLDELTAKTEIITRNMFGNTAKTTDFLLEDLTGQCLENYVRNELHELSTSAGQTLLSPAKGSFYPGVANTHTEFKMYKYVVVPDVTLIKQSIAEKTYKDYLFIYTENNVKIFIITKDEAFAVRQTYYKLDRNGAYVKLVRGVDFNIGDPISSIKDYVCLMKGKFEEGITYYKQNDAGEYVVATDYTVGDDIPPGRYYIYQSVDVYIAISQPVSGESTQANFMAAVNDTTAVVTTEKRVILTDDNMMDYENFYGTMVDVGLRDSRSKLLTLGEDYEFTDVNLAKTEKTFTEQAIYDHVRVLTEAETDTTMMLGISYQAYGGQVMPSDVRNIRQDVANAMSILGEHQLLTVNNLPNQPMIKELISRIRRMEQFHDHFAQVDHLVYKGMKGFHWINFATLYDLNWFEDLGDNPIKEIGTFRVSSRDQRWCYEFTVTVDLSKDEENCLSLKTLGATGVDLNNLEQWQNLPVKERIGVRLCWNNTGKSSGAVLQLGWDFDNYNYKAEEATWDTDTITVTNKSGNTSFFRLYSNPLEVTKDADASINIYGHVMYVPFEGIAQSNIPYFKSYQEYMYYLTGAVRIQSGTVYYKRDTTTGTYIEDTDVRPGQLVKDVGYSVYERSAYRTLYKRETVVVGKEYTFDDGLYIVDDTNSFSDYAFTFINQTEYWDHVNNPEVSKCSTMYLEDSSGGLVIWLGNYPLRPFSFGPNQGITPLTIHCSLTPEDQNIFNANKIKDAIVLFYDRKEGRYFSSTLAMCSTGGKGQSSSGDGIWFMEDLCGMSLRVYDSDRSRYYYYALTNSSTRMEEGKAYYLRSGEGTTADPYVYTQIDQFVPTARFFSGGKYYRLYKSTTSDSVYMEGKTYYKYDSTNKKYVVMIPYIGEGIEYDYKIGDPIPTGTVFEGRDRYAYLSTINNDTTYAAAKMTWGTIYAWYIGFPTTATYVLGGPLYSVQVNAVYDIDLQVGMGTSSWMNDRFDLRQVKIHF